MIRINNLLLGGSAQALSLKFTDAAHQAGGTNYTFSSLGFGQESTERLVIVAVGWSTSAAAVVSSVTIGGVSATIVKQASSPNAGSALLIAAVPSGISGNIVVNMSAACALCAVAVYSLLGRTSAGVAANATASDIASPTLDGSIAVPAGGIAIATCFYGTTGAATWTGLTEDNAISIGFRQACASGSFEQAQSPLAVQAAVGASPNASFVCASWGP